MLPPLPEIGSIMTAATSPLLANSMNWSIWLTHITSHPTGSAR